MHQEQLEQETKQHSAAFQRTCSDRLSTCQCAANILRYLKPGDIFLQRSLIVFFFLHSRLCLLLLLWKREEDKNAAFWRSFFDKNTNVPAPPIFTFKIMNNVLPINKSKNKLMDIFFHLYVTCILLWFFCWVILFHLYTFFSEQDTEMWLFTERHS